MVDYKKLKIYLQDADKRPFFVSAEGDEYLTLKTFLSGMSIIRVSDFCYYDSFPDLDELIYTLQCSTNDTLLLGVGEFASLSGRTQIVNQLRCKCFPKKVVVLCRNLRSFLEREASIVPKLKKNFLAIDSSGMFSVVQYLPSLPVEVETKNFRELLRLLEDGAMGTVEVKSEMPLQEGLLLSTPYEVLKYKNPRFFAFASEEVLSNEQWERVLTGKSNESERKYLQCIDGIFANKYERFAFEQSSNYAEFTKNLFFALLKLKPTDEKFDDFYQQRKELVKNCDETFLSEYVAAVKAQGASGIFYLTDNTAEEFQTAMELVQLSDVNRDVLKKNFPDLKKYMTTFEFDDERLTEYFQLYKELKLFDSSEEFLPLVEQYSEQRIFNVLETRQAILDRISDAKLYWLDGLGVEFLSFIKQTSKELDLSTKIHVARAELPTLTSTNKNFFDDWIGEKFRKNERLDELRHGKRNLPRPSYVYDELCIVKEALEEIEQVLKRGKSSKVILTSDHGSSRGAVKCRGKTWRMNSVGEHGGRCCLIDVRDEKPNCAAESNGYYSLSNYDRFQGGRLEGVELHGGATLEEVVVPVIEIFLQRDRHAYEKIGRLANPADGKAVFVFTHYWDSGGAHCSCRAEREINL